MVTIIGFAGLALLVVIALELYLVIIGLARVPAMLSAKDEKKDSPTINVNVGTVPTQEGQQARPPLQAAEAEPAAISAPEPPPPEPEPEPPPPPPQQPPPQPSRPRASASTQATTSGLLVVKCPKCQAENSSYRGECFNCGNKL